MLRTNSIGSPIRLAIAASMGFVLLLGSSLLQATPSHADFNVGIEDGAGSGGAPVSGGTKPWSPAPAPAPGGGGGSGGGTPGAYWVYHWGVSPCGPRPIVGNAIGYREQMVKQEITTPSQDQPPAGAGWTFSSYFPGYGAYWYRTIAIGAADCLYPPLYNLVTQECILSTNAKFEEIVPNKTTLAERTVSSGYSAGTPDPAACAASRTHVALNANIVRYSYVEGIAVSQAVTHTFKVYTEVDPRTNAVPATEIVGTVGPYNLPAKHTSASLTCHGPSVPGIRASDFTENSCSPENRPWDPTYVCNADPVLFDTRSTWGLAEEMRSSPGNSVQYVKQDFSWTTDTGWTEAKHNDMMGRKMIFNQNPSGSGITVNGYSTSYERDKSSTPYETPGTPTLAGKKLAELDVFLPDGQKRENALRFGGLTTESYSGKANTVKLILMDASDQGAPTKISQLLEWTGTRQVSTIQITGLDPVSGAITYTTSTADVPTSGKCRSTATIEGVRAIGDKVPE